MCFVIENLNLYIKFNLLDLNSVDIVKNEILRD